VSDAMNDIATTSAPEICVEIMLPSNTQREMKAKTAFLDSQ